MTDRRELDLDGFRQRSTGVPPPPRPTVQDTPAPPPAKPMTPPVTSRSGATTVTPRRPQERKAPTGGGGARMVLNVPWAASVWAKGVAKGLDLSLADLLHEILTAHTANVASDLAANPPVGKRAGSGPYDHFTFRADPVLRARIDETAEQLGFANRSELVSRLLESARRIDGEAYGRRLDERTKHLLQN